MQDIKLYCLSCAGGTTALYRDWKGRGVEVCPFEFSGRGTRFHEPLYRSMDEAVGDLLPRIDTRHPYALFGHSMGSILCYELLVRLHKEQLPTAEHAFFSAANPPGATPCCDYGSMSDDVLTEHIYQLGGTDKSIISNKNLMKLFLSIFRADYHLLSSYNHNRDYPVVDCNISVLFGDEDPEMKWSDLWAWQRYTAGRCEFKAFPGDHFYLNTNKEALLDYIGSRLTQARRA